MMRQPVGVGVERRVGERAVPEHHGDGVRRALRLRGKQRRQVAARRRWRFARDLRQRRIAAERPMRQMRRCRSRAAGWCRARPAPGCRSSRARGPDRPPRPPAAAAGAAPASRCWPRRTGRAASRGGTAAHRPAARSAPAGNASHRGPATWPSLQPVAGHGKPGAVDRIVLEHQERIEQLAQSRRLLDLGQPDMLMRHQPRLAVLGLPQQLRQLLLPATAASAAAAC